MHSGHRKHEFERTMAEISSGLKRLASPMDCTSITGLPFSSRTCHHTTSSAVRDGDQEATLKGHVFMSDCTLRSPNRRPIKRLASNTAIKANSQQQQRISSASPVFLGFIAAWFLAASPTSRSVSVNAT